MTDFHKIWIEQCEAAEGLEGEFGTQKALDERQNLSIRACLSQDGTPNSAKKKSNSTPKRSRTCGRTTSANALVIYC